MPERLAGLSLSVLWAAVWRPGGSSLVILHLPVLGPVVAAQAAPGGLDVEKWVQWGVLGLVLALILVGQLVPKYVVDRADREFERVRQQRDELVGQLKEVVPVLGQVNNTMLPTLDRMTHELVEARQEIRRLSERLSGDQGRTVG